jgi:hypothetical protein
LFSSSASAVFRAADVKEWAALCASFNKRMCEAPPPPLQHGVLMTSDSFWKMLQPAIEARHCALRNKIKPF